jgi:photosystem II stability/assembly factor-like uncharacterized protein
VKTTNGGTTWSLLTTGTTSWFYAVDFFDLQTGIAVGHNGAAIKTTNGGTSWTAISTGQSSTLYDVYFHSADTVFACSAGGKILRSVNGGTTWTITTTAFTNRSFNAIVFVSPDTGYVAGEYGLFMKTTDKGNTWTKVNHFTGNTILDFTATTSGYFYVCGTNGMIMSTRPDTTTGICHNQNDLLQISFYPNPATDRVFFQLKETRYAVYQLFDMSGKLVQAGSAKDGSVDVSMLSPGMFLIVLDVDGQKYSGKILKTKQ